MKFLLLIVGIVIFTFLPIFPTTEISFEEDNVVFNDVNVSLIKYFVPLIAEINENTSSPQLVCNDGLISVNNIVTDKVC